MGSTSGGRSWRKVFGALALGLIVVAGVFGTALAVSENLRLLYATGALILFLFAAWLGSESPRDWPNFLLLYVPLAAMFAFFVLHQLPFLWPQLLLLAFAVVVDSAPVFSFQPVSEGGVPVAATSGKILLIDFFGTWCPRCIAELPELQLVRSTLSKRDDIQFVVVATNSGGDTPERLRTFGRVRHITLPLAFDPGGKAHAAFGLSGFPGIVVIERTGHVRLTRQGCNSSETSFRGDFGQLLESLQ